MLHVQDQMATLISDEFSKQVDIKEIKKVSTSGTGGFASFLGPQQTVTESIKPSEPVLKPFNGVEIGDFAISA